MALDIIRRQSKKKLLAFVILYIIIYQYTIKPKQDVEIADSDMSATIQIQTRNVPNNTKNSFVVQSNRKYKYSITFGLVLCNYKGKLRSTAVSSQIKQFIVLLKSALALTKEFLRFVIVTESITTFDLLYNKVNMSIPQNYRKKFQLYHRMILPIPSGWRKNEYKPCISQRLLFLKILEGYDSVIHMDNDMIFMNSPENLWKEFYKFNDSQMVALAPPLATVNIKRVIPSYKKDVGLNAGLILFNITRMNNFPGGFISTINELAPIYNKTATMFDQDMFNIIFSKQKYTKHFYELDCSWNYRGSIDNRCNIKGAQIIHGLDSAFMRKGQNRKIIYDCWKNHELGSSLLDLVNRMVESLNKERSSNWPKYNKTHVLINTLYQLASNPDKHI